MKKTLADLARYKRMDLPPLQRVALSATPPPRYSASLFEAVEFDWAGKGAAVVDITFGKSFISMTPDELMVALSQLKQLSLELGVDGCHLLLPAPDRASWRIARLVILAERFVACLPTTKRVEWVSKWTHGNPYHEAYHEDMSLLASESSLPPQSPAVAKRKICNFFNASAGCRFGVNCQFRHEIAK